MDNWTKESIELVEKFIDIRKRGYYVDSVQLTNVYNQVLNKSVRPTNCGSCLSQRVKELEASLNRYKAKLAKEAEEAKEQEEPVVEPKVEEEVKKEEENNDGTQQSTLSERPKPAKGGKKRSKQSSV